MTYVNGPNRRGGKRSPYLWERDMPKTSDTAIVCYSLSGHSKRIAQRLANDLGADLIALSDPRYGPNWVGYMRAVWHSLRQNCVLAPQTFTSLDEYHTLVICGPIWTSYPATPLRALMKGHIPLPARIALFLTCGNHNPVQKTLDLARDDLGRDFVATACLGNSQQDTAQEEPVVAKFLSDLTRGATHASSA